MKKFTAIFALTMLVLTFAAPAFALDLDEARAKGLVGEKLDGYVAVVAANPEASKLVLDVNKRRKAEYEKISAANGQPLSVVGKVAAEQVINGLPSGAMFESPNGGWSKK